MRDKNRKQMRIRRICLLLLWILSLAAISFYGGAVSYGFFFGVTLLPVLSLVYLTLVYLCFKVYQKVESRSMVCGQPTPYFFVLQNDSRVPFVSVSVRLFSSFSYVETMPDDTEYELLPGDRYTYETRLVCRYRGEYAVGIKEITVTDFLRLFCLRYRVPSAVKAVVKPKITRVSELGSMEELAVVLQRDCVAAGMEPDVVVRDYVAGDQMKQIHWKATAREQKLKVRQRIGEEKQGILLLGDTKRYSRQMREYLPLENKMLETLTALGIYLAERNVGFSACYGQRGLVVHRVNTLGEFDGFYEAVSGIVFHEDEDFLQTLRRTSESGLLAHTGVVFAVLHQMSPKLLQVTDDLMEAGLWVVLYVVTEESLEEYLRMSNERRKIIVIPVEAELEGRL